jgi:hypothetical protein
LEFSDALLPEAQFGLLHWRPDSFGHIGKLIHEDLLDLLSDQAVFLLGLRASADLQVVNPRPHRTSHEQPGVLAQREDTTSTLLCDTPTNQLLVEPLRTIKVILNQLVDFR